MGEQKKKRQRINDLLHAETKPKHLCLSYKKQRKTFTRNSFLRKRGSGGGNKNQKEGFLTSLATAIKKDPTTPIRNQANELKVHKKTVRTVIKEDLSSDLWRELKIRVAQR